MQLVGSFDPDTDRTPSRRQALLDEAAFAIWRTWARVGDNDAARSRFGRLPAAVRKNFDEEADACFRVFERARL